MHALVRQEWDSYSELRKYISLLNGFLLDSEIESPQKYVSYDFTEANDLLRLGVVLGCGLDDYCLQFCTNGYCISYNQSVTVITICNSYKVVSQKFESPVYQIIDHSKEIIVRCEIGIALINYDGELLWYKATPLITNMSIESNGISLSFDESGSALLDWQGNII